jgi:hypothetical protein
MWLAAACALGAGSVADAHHSGAMFDFSKCEIREGTVRKLEWVYPHSWLWIVVAGGDAANPDVWGFEFMSPLQAMAIDKRWKKDVMKSGDKVTVKFSPHKDGRHAGAMASVTLPDGSTLSGSPGLCNGVVGKPPPPPP